MPTPATWPPSSEVVGRGWRAQTHEMERVKGRGGSEGYAGCALVPRFTMAGRSREERGRWEVEGGTRGGVGNVDAFRVRSLVDQKA